MKSIMSKLTEKITLLKNSGKTDTTTVNRFEPLLKTRAYIRATNSKSFEIIIPKLPVKCRNIPFSAIEWNDAEYIYVSPIAEYKGKFLKGKVTLWRSKLEPLRG